ncbi:CCA tRNA nucleotidyltransferase [Saccharibacillus alkalitolerans]|uniref:CCA tRNA nucleotidyltransferase n=1 Tax=Saccharibacillus alkalitolerans TaxID=2705290 RepID=UPI001F2014B0|nr:CCA tRNA nucleotidyltransferase [Saccharibacillus alkalitolerans]
MTQWKHADPQQVRLSAEILRSLEAAGHTACWVGGCVRDELIGRPVNDMDIATSARPEEVTGLFERTVPTGIEHGTVTVVMEKIPFEVTTFRTESDYKDFRRPEEVTFVRSLDEDLRRRDFTMNAIARRPDGEYVDPYGGRTDLAKGVIRCVGDARERFREDALRMLRGVRFASVFGFELEPRTWEAMLELRDNMRHIAAERIRAELEKMLGGTRPAEGLRLLERSGLLAEAKIRLTPQALASARPERLGALPPKPAELRWAALLQGLGVSGDEAETLLKSWTFSGGFAKSAAALLRIDARMGAGDLEAGAGKANEAEKAAVRAGEAGEEHAAGGERRKLSFVRCVLDFGRAAAENWLLYRSALNGEDEAAAARRESASAWLAEIPAESPRELALGGNEIVGRLSRKPGPWLGALIRQLLEGAAMGRFANEREALLAEIARLEEEKGMIEEAPTE